MSPCANTSSRLPLAMVWRWALNEIHVWNQPLARTQGEIARFDGFFHLMNWNGQHAFASKTTVRTTLFLAAHCDTLLGLYLSSSRGRPSL